MEKQHPCRIEPEKEAQEESLDKNPEFLENFQNAILLALLEKGQLAKRQFDYCVSECERRRKQT